MIPFACETYSNASLESSLFVQNRTRDELDANAEIAAALLCQFIILGEAAYTISRSLKNRHPEVEWRTISGMRHWIVHAYFKINLTTVWETAINDVPALRDKIRSILNEEFGQSVL
jgi:uncharacterized protein with HEPN domain